MALTNQSMATGMADQPSWHHLTSAEVTTRLRTSATDGISPDEASLRLRRVGRNEMERPEGRRLLALLVQQFVGPLTLILAVATVVSLVIGEHLDAVAIGAILVVNGLLGFVQEWRADRAIEALEAMLVPRCRVLRGRDWMEIDAAELVPGDVVELVAGDRVPADLRLLSCVSLLIDESALTGESVSVTKTSEPVPEGASLAERSSLAHMGTEVMVGAALGVVVATGKETELGTIVSLTTSAVDQEVPLQRTLADLARRLGQVALVIAALTVGLGVAVGRPAADMFLTGVSLAVAVVPEGLPAVVTVTLAVGIRTMSRRRALLRHLEAAETLGEASVICTDKTGTLTMNRMDVRELWTTSGSRSINGVDPASVTAIERALLESGMVCNNARPAEAAGTPGLGDPIELALLTVASNLGVERPLHERLGELPFDSTTKLMAVVIAAGEQRCCHVKGAPEVVLERCARLLTYAGDRPLADHDRRAVLEAQQVMAEQGLRVLALARRAADDDGPVADDLTFLGLVGMHDPPRPEAPAAVEQALAAGLDVIVMTGDAGATALSIANQVGLPATYVLTGTQVDDLDDDRLVVHLDGSAVLARVSPAHKMRVVRLLQEQGQVVAMTGDGVNDAPALEQASIGIAMGLRGTDVARGAADLVLADDNFASIVAAIEEGRRQYANIQKFIRYLLSSNLGEVILISGSVALGWPLALLPAQILWMNLLTDGVTALALGLERAEPDTMQRPPRPPSESVFGRVGIWWIAGMGGLIGLVTMVVFRVSLGTGDGADLVRAQTLAFTCMVLLETVNVFNFRSERQALFRIGLFTNPWLLVAAASAVLVQVMAVHVPGLARALGTSSLDLRDWAILVACAIPILAVGELAKVVRR